MQNHQRIQKMTAAALLIAVGTVIPMFMPKVIIGPASFTLASHVAIFISMLISPTVALVVSAGTTIGFQLAAFPPVIVLRAATHVVFALIGSFWLQKRPTILQSPAKTQVFSFFIGLLHALCEVVVVSFFYFGGAYPGETFVTYVLGFIGAGSVVHSMIDFAIALAVYYVLVRQKAFSSMFIKAPAKPSSV